MTNPFPGIDPFIEGQEWEDFHARFNTAISDAIAVQVQPRYVVRVERRVYVELPQEHDENPRRPDVVVTYSTDAPAIDSGRTRLATATLPLPALIPMPEERRESYLVVRDRETLEVVTVIETLSPANKRRDGAGRREYRHKREIVLESHSHLVELDFLRGGVRAPMSSTYPLGDYFAMVSRAERRPHAEVYAWSLRDILPTIMLPLRLDDADVPLDLQQVYESVYDRARYDLSLDRTRTLSPPLDDANNAWMRGLLTAAPPAVE